MGLCIQMNRNKNQKDKLIQDRHLMLKVASDLMSQGVKIRDFNRVDFRGELLCGKNVSIDVNVIFEGKVELGDDVSIGANCILIDCKVGSKSTIKPFSLIEGSEIGRSSFIGPYARLRPGTVLKDFVQIGNFVEVKNSNIDNNARINHLSFIGDADLSENVTIGAGSITCNHDGEKINNTSIGKDSFIGSGVKLIAPLKLGENVTIGAGSTINKDVPNGKLVIARAKQIVLNNWRKIKK